MNRPIKFRSFDSDQKRMHGVGICNCCHNQGDIAHLWEMHEYQAMQFTGLHDKNGKEIYEGDILRQFVHSGPITYFYEVLFDKETAGFKLKHVSDEFGINLYEIDDEIELKELEVIGHVFENPQLLEKK